MKNIKFVLLIICFFIPLKPFTFDDLTPKTTIDGLDFLLGFATSASAHASTDDWIMPTLYATAATGAATTILDASVYNGSGWKPVNPNNKIFYSAEGEVLGMIAGKTARYTVKGACWLMLWLKRAVFGYSHERELAEARKQLHEIAERVKKLEDAEKNSGSSSSAVALPGGSV